MRNKTQRAARTVLHLVPLVALLACGCNKHSGTPANIGGKYVYTETNSTTSDGNTVVALQTSGSGTLTNPRVYNTGGTGASEPALMPSGVIDTDRNVIVDPSQTLLYAVNQGSDTIAAFRIQSDGSLIAVSGSPFPSGGHAPVSLGLTGNVLTVVNSNLDPARTASLAGSTPNITSFRVNNDGSLTASGSTISLPAGSAPSIALPSPSGTLIFSADFLTDQIRSFQVASNGALTQSPNSPVAPDASIFTQPGVKAGAAHHPLGYRGQPQPELAVCEYPTCRTTGGLLF